MTILAELSLDQQWRGRGLRLMRYNHLAVIYDREWGKGRMPKFNLGNPGPWEDACTAYGSVLQSTPNGDASEQLAEKAN